MVSAFQIYRGYVDDPRNTDNAWMETVAYNFHDEKGDSVGQFKLHAGQFCSVLGHGQSPNRFHPSPAPVITIFEIFAASDTL